MKRWTVAALAAVTLLSATAIAKTVDFTRTASTPGTQRVQRHAVVNEYKPSVNAVIDTRSAGAYVIP